MNDSPDHLSPDEPPGSTERITEFGAAQIARLIAGGELSARETLAAFIDRIEEVNPRLNALVVPLLDEARSAADTADRHQAAGRPLGPLHGVPVTIKECFHVAGTASTMGLTHLVGRNITDDAILVRRLRQAGAIVLGKTNLPQLMLWHESDNPVYGLTKNPWDLSRGSGGSSGGEASIIAARGSPLGLGSDLGGSIRVPAHFCGIAGIKPTSRRLPRSGTVDNLRGMDAMQFQPGPMARLVEDLQLALEVLCGDGRDESCGDVLPAPLSDPRQVRVEGMRIAYWTDDGYFPAAPAIRQAVERAAEALRERGAIVQPWQPPQVDRAMDLYYGLMGADGGADARRIVRGSTIDWRLRRLTRLTRMPNYLRCPSVAALRALGQHRSADLMAAARGCSADRYWRLTYDMMHYKRQFMQQLQQGAFQAMLFPPHALPALPHGRAIELIPAASYSILPNLLGIPAGVVPIMRVPSGRESDRPASRDRVERLAKEAESGSAGLPVGVQVAAGHWREDVVLAVMAALEEAFRETADYPLRPSLT